jgi:flavin-dependent dehydrogenase
MYEVGIVGAGVGGSYLSCLLSKKGLDNIVFDFRAPHEKLCGGGVSYKAVVRFPILNELPCHRKMVWNSTIISPKERVIEVASEKPLTIFNRRDLDYSLLKKAIEFGAHFRKEKVQSFTLEEDHWRIFTADGDYRARVLVGADGVLSKTGRKLKALSTRGAYFFALGCFLDAQQDFVTYKFFSDLKGYLWAFPRVDSLALGIASRYYGRETVDDMKGKLLHFIERYYPGKTKRISLRGAYIPFFSANGIQGPSICSKNWALIGDAAAFVDPIAGEGIYYALFSADILASCISEGSLSLYGWLCEGNFGKNLAKASQGFDYFYHAGFVETMGALAEESQSIRKILSEMIVGNLDYASWKSSLRRSFFKILADFMFNCDLATKREVITNLVTLFPNYR